MSSNDIVDSDTKSNLEPSNAPQANEVSDVDKEPLVTFKKVVSKKNVKKRTADHSIDEEESVGVVTKRVKTAKSGLEDEAAEADSGVSKLEGTSYGFSYASSGAKRVGLADQGATQTNMQGADRPSKSTASSSEEEPSVDQNGKQIYKGQANYKQYIQKSKYSGPIRATAHIRADVRMDYARDICKDYKETGYCGYGDACIFLHDRSDYAAGWQIEKEWELSEKKRREAAAAIFSSKSKNDNNDPSITEDGLTVSSTTSKDLPFACYICRKPFTQPVVTKCGHYFCQDCALKRYQTDKTCAVCKEPTLGSFNSGVKILKRRDELLKLQGK